MNILVLKGDSYSSVIHMFRDHGNDSYVLDNISQVAGADIVVFTGGSDVSPELYGEKNTSSYNDKDRDLFEVGVYLECVRQDKTMVGICRGGQFLNVMAGGKMRQHIENHTGRAVLSKTFLGDFWLKGDHHQEMIPSEGPGYFGEVFAVDKNDGTVLGVCYQELRTFCFQQHPEWDRGGETEYFFFEALNKYGYTV